MELVKTKSEKNRNFLTKVLRVFQPAKKVKTVDPTDELPKTETKNFDQQLQADFDLIDNISKFLKETEEIIEPDLNESLQEMSEIEILPTELICKIFDFLDFNDRKNASLVCKKWRNAYLESYYLKNIMIKANNHLFLSRPNSSSIRNIGPRHRASSAMTLSSNFNFQLYNNLVNLEFENDSADVCLLLKNLQTHKNFDRINVLPKLKSLKFTKTTMSSKTLIDLISEAPCLENLVIIECDSLFMTGFLTLSPSQNRIDSLENLKNICFSKNRYLTDQLLNLFLNSTNKLESLDLSYCNFTKTNFKSIEHQRFQAHGNCVLTFENLINQPKNFENLKSINLSGIENLIHNQDSFFDFIETLPNLKEIYLANLPNLKIDTVQIILDIVPGLKLIDLSNSVQNDDLKQTGVENFLSKSRYLHEDSKSRLEVIKFNRAKINDPKIFSDQFSFMNRLTYLDLSSMMFLCSFGTVDRLNQFIETFAINLSKCVKLETLILSYCDFIVNDTFIKIISKNLINLKILDIKNCSKITDKSLHYISTYLSKLLYLDLSWCQNISDYGLDGSIPFGDDTKLLNEFKKHMNGSCRCLRKYTEQPFLLMKTKNDLNSEKRKQFLGCVETGHETFIDNNNNNETLIDDEISPLTSLKNLKFLKTLKLEACVNITDLGLYNGVNWKQLYELDIKLCTNITGDFVKEEEVQDIKLFSNFKILNLNQCVRFSEDNLLHLVKNSGNLKELSIGGISGITNKLIETLLNMRKMLVLLDISFCSDINEGWVERYEQFLFNEFGLRDFFIDKRFISK